jgi:hypothetical protein
MTGELYRIFHILGFLMVFAGLCGLWGLYSAGQAPAKNARVALALIHGLGMALVLVTGFGRLAQLGIMASLPGWVIAKIVIWLILGGSMTLAKRRSQWGIQLVVLWLVLGATAAYLALLKPF